MFSLRFHDTIMLRFDTLMLLRHAYAFADMLIVTPPDITASIGR